MIALVKLSRIVVSSCDGWIGAVGFGGATGDSMRLTTESWDVGGVLGIVWKLPNSLMASVLALRALAAIRV